MNNASGAYENENFFKQLEIKPEPKLLKQLKPVPGVKLELKNVLSNNLEENEKLSKTDIDDFVSQLLMNVKKKEIANKPLPLIFNGPDIEVSVKKSKKKKKSKDADDEENLELKIPKKSKKKVSDSNNYIPDNNVSLKEFIENVRKMYETEPSVELDISPKYLYNKGLFKNSITDILKKYDLHGSKVDVESCDQREDVNEDVFTPFNHQLLVKDYLNITSPYRGLLLYHGLGSGKTCTSIGIIEGFKYNKKIYILTPKSLQKNYKTQLQHCGDKIYNSNSFWYFKDVEKNDKPLMNELSKITGVPSKIIKKNGGIWLIDTTKKTNKDELTRQERENIKEQINISLENKYTFITYNGDLRSVKFFKKFTKGDTINPFDNSVVIIDESHNFTNAIVNRLKKPNTNTFKLYHLLMNAEDSRVILLSGTPVINYPNEIAVIMNILRGYIKTLIINLSVETSDAVDKNFFKKLFKKFNFVDYFDYNSNSGILKVTKNPYGFVHQYDEGNETDGLVLDESGNLTFTSFKDKIVKILTKMPGIKDRKVKLFKIRNVEVVDYKNLPDSFEEFQKEFIDPSKKIINKNKLQRRIVGLVSHLGDKEKLMPNIVRENVIQIDMSDYQVPIYAEARSNEIKQEKQNKKKQKKSQIIGEIYEGTTSTYRIFSRAFCNFVFPEDIKRPLPMKNLTEVIEQTGKEEATGVDESVLDPITDASKMMDLESIQDEGIENNSIGESQKDLYNKQIERALKLLHDRKDQLLTHENLNNLSPKFLACLQNIINPEYNGTHLLYSQFRTIEGIGIFKLVLEANGFVELKLKTTIIQPRNIEQLDVNAKNVVGETKYVLDIPEEKWGLPKFALYTGTENEIEKEYIRNIVNSDWDNLPEPLLSQVRRLGSNNYYGDICKVLMITAAGAEGINLKNVRYVHLMEPYWHPVRIEQVIGRARRICSHKDLPEEFRNIETFLYIMKFSEEQKNKKEFKEIVANDNNETSDERLLQIMTNKMTVNQSLLNVLKETSIDCTVHQKDKQGSCFKLPVSDKSTYLTKPDYYERSGETKKENKEVTYKTVKLKGKRYIIYEKNQLIDYDIYMQSKQVVVLGKTYKDNDKKDKFTLYKK